MMDKIDWDARADLVWHDVEPGPPQLNYSKDRPFGSLTEAVQAAAGLEAQALNSCTIRTDARWYEGAEVRDLIALLRPASL
ncbi:MAG: hypothetical protein AB7V39_24420 [Nitrospiraceae bacterium]